MSVPGRSDDCWVPFHRLPKIAPGVHLVKRVKPGYWHVLVGVRFLTQQADGRFTGAFVSSNWYKEPAGHADLGLAAVKAENSADMRDHLQRVCDLDRHWTPMVGDDAALQVLGQLDYVVGVARWSIAQILREGAALGCGGSMGLRSNGFGITLCRSREGDLQVLNPWFDQPV